MKRIFISSTVYDLIDVRAELFQELKHFGFVPILSDQLLSGFDVRPDMNAIQCCLANIESCDEYIILLSQRYGFIPTDLGYSKSITHLEYEEAKRLEKKIHFFVRDRLEAEFRVWKRNSDRDHLSFSWVGSSDRELFSLIDSHQALSSASSGSNWVKTFSSSVDLKLLVRKEFGELAEKHKLEKEIKENITPFINLEISQLQPEMTHFILELKFKNLGRGHAYNFQVKSYKRNTGTFVPLIKTKVLPSASNIKTTLHLDLTNEVTPNIENYRVSYQTIDGHKIEDEIDVTVEWAPPRPSIVNSWAEMKSKKYSLGSESLIEYQERILPQQNT